MAIKNTAITTAAQNTEIFACGGTLPNDEQEHAITCMIFCNITPVPGGAPATPATLTVKIVSRDTSGGSGNNTTTVVNSLVIPAGETFTFDTEKIVLSTGDSIHAYTSATGLLVSTISSMRVS